MVEHSDPELARERSVRLHAFLAEVKPNAVPQALGASEKAVFQNYLKLAVANRSALKRMIARKLAGAGYAVLVVNPYYRDVAGEQFADFAAFIAGGGFQKVGPWRGKLNAETIMRDATAIVGWLDKQSGIDAKRGIGTQGYCMGGPFTVWSAAAVPARVKAAASFHGGGLVRPDNPMSPHALLGKVDANLLIAVAQDDDAKAAVVPQMEAMWKEALGLLREEVEKSAREAQAGVK